MGAVVAVLNKRNRDATEMARAMLDTFRQRSPEIYGLATPAEIRMRRDLAALKNSKLKSATAIGYAFSKVLERDKPQLLKVGNTALVLEGRLYQTKKEKTLEAATENLGTHPREAAALIKNAEGDFTFAIAESQQIIAGRDTMGTRPLYYGENASFCALASERKALWRIGIKSEKSFPPGNTALLNKHGFTFKPQNTLKRLEIRKITLEQAAKKVQKLLERSVADRVEDVDDVAVAFSGGLDSSLVAAMAKSKVANLHLIHVSLKGQKEIWHAQKAAEELGLPIHVCLYEENEVEKALPHVLLTTEEADPVKVAIGIPFFWTAQKASKENLKVILAGQGADELFGGYKRHSEAFIVSEKGETEKTLFNDVVGNYKNNVERDFKIYSSHGVELRLPFASYQLAKYALTIPLKLNLGQGGDSIRKLVLRKTAESIGLPRFVTRRPKKAIQYATGVSKALRKLAKRSRRSMKEYLQQVFRATLEKEVNEKWKRRQ